MTHQQAFLVLAHQCEAGITNSMNKRDTQHLATLYRVLKSTLSQISYSAMWLY